MSERIRSATINRDTNETKIQLSLNLDGGALDDAAANGDAKSHAAQSSKAQFIDIDSGIGFLDHMLHALAKHAGWSLRLRCRGDLHSMSSYFMTILNPQPTTNLPSSRRPPHCRRYVHRPRTSLKSRPPDHSGPRPLRLRLRAT